MKVNDLIKKLKKLPADSQIVVTGYEGGLADVINTKEISIRRNVNKEWYYGRHEVSSSGEHGAIKAVMIVAEQRTENNE
ncbi:MAG: hypothetical protein PF545_05445 [Elusimicrobia bacterium]|jgi:hypothetical protein|nr:hypothetical protein [Elusimicrobiota bacterium]